MFIVLRFQDSAICAVVLKDVSPWTEVKHVCEPRSVKWIAPRIRAMRTSQAQQRPKDFPGAGEMKLVLLEQLFGRSAQRPGEIRCTPFIRRENRSAVRAHGIVRVIPCQTLYIDPLGVSMHSRCRIRSGKGKRTGQRPARFHGHESRYRTVSEQPLTRSGCISTFALLLHIGPHLSCWAWGRVLKERVSLSQCLATQRPDWNPLGPRLVK